MNTFQSLLGTFRSFEMNVKEESNFVFLARLELSLGMRTVGVCVTKKVTAVAIYTRVAKIREGRNFLIYISPFLFEVCSNYAAFSENKTQHFYS